MNKKVIEKIIKDSYINENYDFDFNQDGLTDLTFAISIFLAGMSDNCSLMFKSINTSILSDTVTVKSSNGDIVEKINFAQLLNEGSKISKDILWYSNGNLILYESAFTDFATWGNHYFGSYKIDNKYVPILVTYDNMKHLGRIKISYDLSRDNPMVTIHEYCIQK